MLTHHVSKYVDKYPTTEKMMLKNTFVDDIIGGGQSQQEADKFVKEAEEIAKEAGMKIQRYELDL